MIRVDKDGDHVRKIKEFSCMSYDVPNLPTNVNHFGGYIPTSSTAFVIDTSEAYMYSEDDEAWHKQ
jgi:hypothetical protein